MVDVSMVVMIGIAFAGIMVIAIVIWEISDMFRNIPASSFHTRNQSFNTSRNITGGFDDAVNLLLVAITIFILAIAIGALLMLKGR